MAQERTVAFRQALLVTQDESRRVLRGDLLLRGPRVEAVGPRLREGADEEVDARGFLLAPGLINAHTHVANALLRGLADDLDFPRFLERMFAVDARRDEKDIELGALLGGAEMLLSGTTSFLDLYYGQDAVARACDRLGIRGFLGWAVLDPDKTTQKGVPVENARGFLGRWKAHRWVSPLVAPQGVYVCGEETWRKARELALREGTLLHYHLSETRGEVVEHEKRTGLRPALWLREKGLLGPRQVAAHGVWLTTEEIRALGESKVAIAHCPGSNTKLASGGGGVCPVPELRAAGSPVALGTDSSTTNNGLSLLREMHLATLLQKHARHDPTVLPAQETLDLATREGARALGRENELGQLAPGFRADLVLYDLSHPSLATTRLDQAVSSLVYGAPEGAVHTVFVDGEAVVRDRALVRLPWAKVQGEIEAASRSLMLQGGP